jgi:hypothetical protein
MEIWRFRQLPLAGQNRRKRKVTFEDGGKGGVRLDEKQEISLRE